MPSHAKKDKELKIPDYVCPTELGSVPDCGSVCDMLYNVSGTRPRFIGKPSPPMKALTMEKTGVSSKETAVVGDRIYTDIKSGLAAGATAILVMSGETTVGILQTSEDRPDIVLESGDREISTARSAPCHAVVPTT